MRIPESPELLTFDWIDSALRVGGAINKATVVSFEAEPLSEGGGHYGQLARLRLDYDLNETGAPESLVAKFSSATQEMRERPNTIAAYEREVLFYQRLAHQTSLPTPTCYYSDINTETSMHVLLLEDLGPEGVGSKVVGCSPEQAEQAIHQIASFHAEWWEKPQLEELKWLKGSARDPTAILDAHNLWWPDFLRRAEHRLTDQMKEIGRRLGQHHANMMQHPRGTPPRTLCHGDYSLDNLIFEMPDGKFPITVIDWQLTRIGHGMKDVAYFVGESLVPEVRRAIEMELLDVYCQILSDNGVQRYTFGQSLQDYRLALLDRFGSLISTIAAMPFTKDQLQMHIDILLPRNSAAILDNNAGELLV